MTITRRRYSVSSADGDVRIDFDRHNYVISEIDLGDIPATFSTFTGTQQNGRTITSRHLGVRDVTIEGHIIAESFDEMAEKKQRLEGIVMPTSDFWLVIDNQWRIRLTAGTTLQYSKNWYQHNDVLTTFTIEATANNPFFETVAPKSANIGEWLPAFHFPYVNPVGETFVFGRRMISKSLKVNNRGEVPVGLTIRIMALDGNIINPVISNFATGEYFRLNTTIESGEEVVIDTKYGEKSVTNVTRQTNLMPYLDLSSTWLQMAPGTSTFRYDYDERSTGNILCDFIYTPQLIEV